MRELHSFSDERQAHLLANVLKSRSMPAEVTPEGNTWIVWILSDDDRDKARDVLTAFQQNPGASEFQVAEQLVQQQQAEERAQEKARLKLQVRIQDRWSGVWWKCYPATMILIGISVLVVVLCTDWKNASGGRSLIPPTCNNEQSELRNALFIEPPPNRWQMMFPDREDSLPHSLLTIVKTGQVWRFVTPIFLHFSFLHILFNMMWLRNLGRSIEFVRGTTHFVVLVLILAVTSNIGQYSWTLSMYPKYAPGSFGGMSGVDFGLIGYVWMRGRTQPWQGLGIPGDQIVWAVLWMLLCIGGAFGNIANAAHVVGFAVGILIGARQSIWNNTLGLLKGSDDGDDR